MATSTTATATATATATDCRSIQGSTASSCTSDYLLTTLTTTAASSWCAIPACARVRALRLVRPHTRRILVAPDSSPSFGFSVRGGKEFGTGFFVSHVVKNSEADQKGLRIGDQILRVNGFRVDDAVHKEFIQLVAGQERLALKVRSVGMLPVKEKDRDGLSWSVVKATSVSNAPSESFCPSSLERVARSSSGGGGGGGGGNNGCRDVNIVLHVEPRTKLGLGICKGPEWKPGIFVQFTKDKSVAREAGLRPGDQILSVNSIDFADVLFSEAVAVMKGSTALDMTVRTGAGCDLFPGESSGYNSSASSVTGDQSPCWADAKSKRLTAVHEEPATVAPAWHHAPPSAADGQQRRPAECNAIRREANKTIIKLSESGTSINNTFIAEPPPAAATSGATGGGTLTRPHDLSGSEPPSALAHRPPAVERRAIKVAGNADADADASCCQDAPSAAVQVHRGGSGVAAAGPARLPRPTNLARAPTSGAASPPSSAATKSSAVPSDEGAGGGSALSSAITEELRKRRAKQQRSQSRDEALPQRHQQQQQQPELPHYSNASGGGCGRGARTTGSSAAYCGDQRTNNNNNNNNKSNRGNGSGGGGHLSPAGGDQHSALMDEFKRAHRRMFKNGFHENENENGNGNENDRPEAERQEVLRRTAVREDANGHRSSHKPNEGVALGHRSTAGGHKAPPENSQTPVQLPPPPPQFANSPPKAPPPKTASADAVYPQPPPAPTPDYDSGDGRSAARPAKGDARRTKRLGPVAGGESGQAGGRQEPTGRLDFVATHKRSGSNNSNNSSSISIESLRDELQGTLTRPHRRQSSGSRADPLEHRRDCPLQSGQPRGTSHVEQITRQLQKSHLATSDATRGAGAGAGVGAAGVTPSILKNGSRHHAAKQTKTLEKSIKFGD